MRTTQTRWAALVAAMLLTIGFAGCATNRPGGTADEPTTDPTDVETPDSGPDDGAPGDRSPDVAAAWLGEGPTLAIVTWGSSLCRPFVEGVRADGQRIEVTLVEQGDDAACVEDFVPRGLSVAAPAGVNLNESVDLVLSGAIDARIELAGFAGEPAPTPTVDESPAAAWTNAPGVAVVLTYGSSTCPPVVESIAAGTEGALEVRFAEPPADQVCTMDYAPRITTLDTRGLADLDPTLIATFSLWIDHEQELTIAVVPQSA